MYEHNKTIIKSDEIGMRINIREIGFNRKAMRLLGEPRHLNFWWSERERMLFISAADEPTDKSVELPKSTYTRDGAPYIRIRKLRLAILKLIGISESAVVKLRGDYLPELNMIAFKADITDLEVLGHE